MMDKLKIGDRVMYKDIGGKKNKIGTIKEVVTKNNNISGYVVILDDGSILGTSEGELIKLER